MSRLDKIFKPNLNENIFNTPQMGGILNSKGTAGYISNTKQQDDEYTLSVRKDEFFPITTPVGSENDKLFTSIVNKGIDSHLEGFTKSIFQVQDGSLGKRRVFNFHKSELPILLRRLEEIGSEEALQWKNDIENYDNNINEIKVLQENSNWFEQELGYLKDNQTFTRAELRDILETLYKNVDIVGQYRIMYLLQLFGMDEDFR